MTSQTYILFSLAADAILIAILLFLWVRQRSEWHALLWAGGQLSLSLGSASWILGERSSMHYLFAALSLCGAVAAASRICVSKTISMQGMRRKNTS